jgi:uncharacterized membrane protein
MHRLGIRRQFLGMLALATLVTLALFGVRALRNGNSEFSYLIWNLFLAWIPLLIALRLIRVLNTKLWSSWEAVALSLAWLLFLPNSFYIVSDFIHLQRIASVDVLYDAVMFTAFVYLGLTIGFTSLYLIHVELKKRFRARMAAVLIGVVLLLSSFAIYLGRDLRWNSWDVITNADGLLFDLSDRLLQPAGYGQILITTGSFFALLASMYAVLWAAARLIRRLPLV